jgi:hypothetical protein
MLGFNEANMIRMYEERFFFEWPNPVNLDAAAIGISRWTWESIDVSNIDWMQNGAQLIKQNRYDVLPITKQSKVTSYLSIGKNDLPEENNIIHSLHFRTPALGSLSALVDKERNHIFLHNDSHEIVGLLSACNFNCREFATVVFSIITAYESAVANAIRKNNVTVPKTDQYLQAREMNLEVDPVESLNFSTLLNQITKNYELFSNDYGKLAGSKTTFKSMVSRHVKLRNDVAHSGVGRVLVGSVRTLNELHQQLIEIRSLTASLTN